MAEDDRLQPQKCSDIIDWNPHLWYYTVIVSCHTTVAVQFAHKELNQESHQLQILPTLTAKDDHFESEMSESEVIVSRLMLMRKRSVFSKILFIIPGWSHLFLWFTSSPLC